MGDEELFNVVSTVDGKQRVAEVRHMVAGRCDSADECTVSATARNTVGRLGSACCWHSVQRRWPLPARQARVWLIGQLCLEGWSVSKRCVHTDLGNQTQASNLERPIDDLQHPHHSGSCSSAEAHVTCDGRGPAASMEDHNIAPPPVLYGATFEATQNGPSFL